MTIHIPPKRKHLIRYYGLYASRTKGKSKQDGRYEKFGIRKADDKQVDEVDQPSNEISDSDKASKQAWARIIQKVYEVDPLICPYCGSEMRVVAIIQDKESIEKIIACLEKKKPPPIIENA